MTAASRRCANLTSPSSIDATASAANGTQIVMWNCLNDTNQTWIDPDTYNH